MDVVIIEDEPLLAEKLQSELTKADSSIRVSATLSSITEAIEYFENSPVPTLIFSDIQLPDGLSFEIFRKVKINAPVVFCTAFDEYALEAFKVNGIDYILKPFSSEDIENTLSKFKGLSSPKETIELDLRGEMEQLFRGLKGDEQSSILVHLKDRIVPVRKSEIALCLVANSISYILTFEGKRYNVNDNLDSLQKRLGITFYRVNRQYLINREGIASVSQYFARKLLIEPTFKFSDPLVVSKANVTNFLNWLQSH